MNAQTQILKFQQLKIRKKMKKTLPQNTFIALIFERFTE